MQHNGAVAPVLINRRFDEEYAEDDLDEEAVLDAVDMATTAALGAGRPG